MNTLPTAKNWDSYWEVNTTSRFTKVSHSKRRMMKLLQSYIKPGMAVLDAGCGSGFFSKFFIDSGCETYTLDYSKDALAIAKRLTEGRSREYLAEDLLHSDFAQRYAGRFDLIFTDGLFEHFEWADQRKIIENFMQLKKPTGVVATFVPNRYTWWTLVRPFFMPGIEETPLTMGKLKKLHAGMEIVQTGGINVVPLGISPDATLGSAFGMIIFCFAR